MRDHTKLRAFHLADETVLVVYQLTRFFPAEEMYGLTAQMRRAAVSVPSNIVEGCARTSQVEYTRFIEVAYGSMKELQYQSSLARRLDYLSPDDADHLEGYCEESSKVLAALLCSLQRGNEESPPRSRSRRRQQNT